MHKHRGRIEKLESRRTIFKCPTVIRVGNPKTEEDKAQIRANVAAGVRFALLPHKCKSTDEWLARYSHLHNG